MFKYFVSFALGVGNQPTTTFGNLIFDVNAPVIDANGINGIQQQIRQSLTNDPQVSVVLLNIVLLQHAPAPVEGAPAEGASEPETAEMTPTE
jgi:hypothetical protein